MSHYFTHIRFIYTHIPCISFDKITNTEISYCHHQSSLAVRFLKIKFKKKGLGAVLIALFYFAPHEAHHNQAGLSIKSVMYAHKLMLQINSCALTNLR